MPIYAHYQKRLTLTFSNNNYFNKIINIYQKHPQQQFDLKESSRIQTPSKPTWISHDTIRAHFLISLPSNTHTHPTNRTCACAPRFRRCTGPVCITTHRCIDLVAPSARFPFPLGGMWHWHLPNVKMGHFGEDLDGNEVMRHLFGGKDRFLRTWEFFCFRSTGNLESVRVCPHVEFFVVSGGVLKWSIE